MSWPSSKPKVMTGGTGLPAVEGPGQQVQDMALVRRNRLGQVCQGEPAQTRVLGWLTHARRARPGPQREEQVDALLQSRAAEVIGAVHRRQCSQVLRLGTDPQLLVGLPQSRLQRALGGLDVTRGAAGPVPVHVARVLPQLEEHLGRGAHRLGVPFGGARMRTQQVDVDGGNEGEGVDGHGSHRKPGARTGAGGRGSIGRTVGIRATGTHETIRNIGDAPVQSVISGGSVAVCGGSAAFPSWGV